MILQGNVYSSALDMETTVCFVAANNFSKEPPRKVCYLLHGLQGRADNFINYTMLADWCRTYHVLFVLPDGQRSYYTDMAHGQKFFTYLTQDLPKIVRDVFRVSALPEDSYIMGTSMGGYGALKAALTYPENYAACAAFSPACLDMKRYMTAEWREGRDPDAFRRAFGDRIAHDFTAVFGPIGTWGDDHDLQELAKRNANVPKKPRLFTTWGEQDIFVDTNRLFPGQMAELGWQVESKEVPDRMHNWTFFNEALKMGLQFCFDRE
ncbi:MAG: alpha/beta hydrolase fold domain-containing protein [Clostridia bacterium]|nr:alpha/beta hydrolase fold domain-containing protein [Clostridia bacterium]